MGCCSALMLSSAIVSGKGRTTASKPRSTALIMFVLKVGDSAKARKGTGEDRVRSLFRLVDEEWAGARIHTGLSSGEGLIWEVLNPITKTVKEGKGAAATMVEETVDPGVSDKRLLASESEFAGTLRTMRRE